jgi:hypothetical protein
MQKLFSRVQATDLAGSTGRRAGEFLGLLVVSVLAASLTLSITASAQPATPPVRPNLSAEEQKIHPAPQTQDEWRKTMSLTPPPHKGCFTAAYPNMEWLEVQCGVVSGGPHYPSQGNAQGNDNTFIAISTGGVSAAIGSFDSVTGATRVLDSMSGADKFSLQLNTNFFPVSLCPLDPSDLSGHTWCGWQQFVFASEASAGQDAVFLEYWLRDWEDWLHTRPQIPQCPTGWDWVGDGSRQHCRIISMGYLLPHQSITNLRDMILAGSLQTKSNTDSTLNTVTVAFGAGPTMGSIKDGDFLDLTLNFGWTEAEFNVFGQNNASQAQLSPGTTLVVRTQIADNAGNQYPPVCIHLLGFTRETNNLNLIGQPAITVAQFPSITFQESTNSPTQGPDCAASVGDTHLTTFDGLFYDFQTTGEFLLAQPAPDFVVHTQQVSGAPKWPNTAINKALGVKMGQTQVAICLDPYRLEIDGRPARLDKGKSLSLPGGVSLLRRGDTYFIWRPGRDGVRADVNGNEYINVYVGHVPGAKEGGLLGNANGATSDDIAIQGGSVLNQPVSFTDLYGRYADSWRVPPNASLLCKGQNIPSGKPGAPIYANNLTQNQYNYAQGVCTAAGVKDPTLLEACILDVTVIGSDKAANAFVGLTPPVAVMRVQIAASPPGGGVQPPPGTGGAPPGGTPLQIPK